VSVPIQLRISIFFFHIDVILPQERYHDVRHVLPETSCTNRYTHIQITFKFRLWWYTTFTVVHKYQSFWDICCPKLRKNVLRQYSCFEVRDIIFLCRQNENYRWNPHTQKMYLKCTRSSTTTVCKVSSTVIVMTGTGGSRKAPAVSRV